MKFNLIERYIFNRALSAGLLTLGSLVAVVWIVQAMRKFDLITTKGAAVLMYLRLTLDAVPMLGLAVIPIALLIATIYTINTLNANSELVVINASGASNRVIVKPLLILALLCSLLVGFVGHFVIAWSLVDLKVRLGKMQADLVSIVVQEGSFNQVEKGLTFHIAKRDAGGLLRGILISDERDDKKSFVYTAREGIVTKINDASTILLKDGEIHQRDLETGAVTVIKYQSYNFDLSTFSGKLQKIVLRPKEHTTPELINPDPNDFYLKNFPLRFRAPIHERFSEMLWPFANVILILAFAGQARSTRQGYGSAVMAGVTLTMVLRGFGFSALNLLNTDPTAVYMVYVLPLSGIIFGSWFLFRNQPVSLPKPVLNWLDQQQMRMAKQFEQIHEAYIGFRRRRAGVTS